MSRMTYTISVKRWYGWQSFKVHSHVNEAVGATAWCVLNLTDGSVLTIPDIGSKQIRVHADFKKENERVAAERKELDLRASELVRQQLPPVPPMAPQAPTPPQRPMAHNMFPLMPPIPSIQ